MTATLIAMAVMLGLIALEVPIAVAMLVTGVVGCLSVLGWSPTLFMVGETAFSTVNNYSLTVVPLFILMGNLINEADISRELYRATYRFVGHLRGGLAIATVLACAGFAAICGSSLATSAAMTRVAYPEMKRYGYSDALATGCIASAGALAEDLRRTHDLLPVLRGNDTALSELALEWGRPWGWNRTSSEWRSHGEDLSGRWPAGVQTRCTPC